MDINEKSSGVVIKVDAEVVLGSILDEPHLGVRGRRPARTCSSSARRSSFQRAEAQVPVVAGQAGEGRNSSAEAMAWPFGVRQSQGHTIRAFQA